ncbi:MAG: hypothetical protein EOP06_32795 [Proteobacteria bacterium]|nr:MAG: hypothetical protein EOP06_32795 [Pseudomonadota bacterium]
MNLQEREVGSLLLMVTLDNGRVHGCMSEARFRTSKCAAVGKFFSPLGNRALRNADVDFNSTMREEEFTASSATLGFYANNNPFPGMHVDLAANECSFQWKSFLDGFYGDYAYVGKLLRPCALFEAVTEMPAVVEKDFMQDYARHCKIRPSTGTGISS